MDRGGSGVRVAEVSKSGPIRQKQFESRGESSSSSLRSLLSRTTPLLELLVFAGSDSTPRIKLLSFFSKMENDNGPATDHQNDTAALPLGNRHYLDIIGPFTPCSMSRRYVLTQHLAPHALWIESFSIWAVSSTL
jgi:hypothetical protein